MESKMRFAAIRPGDDGGGVIRERVDMHEKVDMRG